MSAAEKRNITDTLNGYRKRLFGFIRKRVSNEADAEDILQDVLYQFVGSTEPIEQASAWLFRVARNKIIDRYRKKKPESLDDMVSSDDESDRFEWPGFLVDGSSDPEMEFLRNLFWETLQSALDELPEEQRTVFVEHELNGVPFLDIAAATGLPVNTLISRKRYAVLHLRERLAGLRNELLTD